jgi:hypothetical protein
MSASFAKAVMPRPKRRAPDPESTWALGWVFPIKTDSEPRKRETPLGLKPSRKKPRAEDRS